jgi:regulator of protease activity HflC (stomatin/prohibitin superfamily)
VVIVDQASVRMIERLGRFNRKADSGLHLVIPFVERTRKTVSLKDGNLRETAIIDLREQVIDFPPQAVITKDNVRMQVNTVIYFQVTDPFKATYEIANLPEAILKLTVTTLRNVMGNMDLEESLISRERINGELRETLDLATDKWGVRVNRVELKDIQPPDDVTNSMEKQIKADREKRARILEAEGFKEAAIREAEGKKQAAILEAEGGRNALILEAEGEAEARLKIAEAEAASIAVEFKGIHEGNPTPDLVAIRYLDALKEMSKDPSAKIYMPYEVSSFVSSLGLVKEAFSDQAAAKPHADVTDVKEEGL